MADSAYRMTRRHGKRATVVQVVGEVINAATGERTLDARPLNIRLVVKEETTYGRIIKAQAAQQDVGSTTFIFWTRDVPFTRLEVEDYIIVDGVTHQVVTSRVENTALVITAREIVGNEGKQAFILNLVDQALSDSVGEE